MSRRNRKSGRQKARREKVAATAEPGKAPAAGDAADTGPRAEEPARRPRTPFDAFRENAEALIVAILLAIIIRHFAVEAFEIPTGSMAPTLLGMHVALECPNCDTEYDAGVRTDSSTGEVQLRFEPLAVYDGECRNPSCGMQPHLLPPGFIRGGRIRCEICETDFPGRPEGYREINGLARRVRCPICDLRYTAVVPADSIRGGHKILVNKFVYFLGNPARWDVIVFEFDQWKNYIKRLVGLPGETIEIIDGDVYVNGEIVRKSDHPYVQEIMWRKISDSDVEERGLNSTPAWKDPLPGGTSPWKASPGGRWSLNCGDGPEVAVLEYQRSFDNFVPYNVLSSGDSVAGEQVGDRKIAFTVRPASSRGWVGAEIRDGAYTFQLRIPLGASGAAKAVVERMTNDDGEAPVAERPAHPDGLRAEHGVSLPVDVPVRVEFENVDDTVLARIDGEEILRLEYVSCPDTRHPPVPNGRLPQSLRLLGSGAQANIESIEVYQDLHYLGRIDGRRWPGITLEEDQYFVLGDNSPSSSDGRHWRDEQYVPGHSLMGKALLVFWPAWPTDFEWKFIR